MNWIKTHPLLSIFLFALNLNSLFVFSVPEILVSSDSRDYLTLSESLYTDGGVFI